MELNEMRLLEKVTLFGLCLFFFFFTVIYLFRFLGGSASKESACKGGDPGSILGSGRPPGEGYDNPLQYSGLEFHGHRSLVGHSSWGCKELDISEWLKATFIYLPALDFNCGMLQHVECSSLKLGALYWQCGVLATRPPRKSHEVPRKSHCL